MGWALSSQPNAELVIKALDLAYSHRARLSDVLFHSAEGSPVFSRKFRQRLWRWSMRKRMSRRGNFGASTPNAKTKVRADTEHLLHRAQRSKTGYQLLHDHTRYSRLRPHQFIGGLTPTKAE